MPWRSARCGRKYGRHDVGLRQRPSSPYTEPIGALSLTLDATFFALSDPKRRGILERLGRGPATLSQLAGPSGLTLNGIKKHVGILELAGLVETEKVGRVRECRLGRATTLGEAGEWIEAHRRAWDGPVGPLRALRGARTVSRELRYERLIQASPARVFDLFTSPAGQREFYGSDAPGWVVDSRCELRVGGAWEIAFGPSPGELYRHRHVFETIERPRRLLLATTETRLDGSRLTFSTEFTFAPRDGATLMTMVQWGLPSEELRDEHGRGLPHAFDRLEQAL